MVIMAIEWVPAWKGLATDVDGGSCSLSDLLNLAARLANDGAALGGRDQEVEVKVTIPVSGPVAVAVAFLPALQGFADQSVSLADKV